MLTFFQAMRGVKSEGMILAASNETKLELVRVPEGAKPGDRVTVAAFPGQPDEQLNPKKKIFETVSADLTTSASCDVVYKGEPLTVNGQKLTVESIVKANIK